MKNRWIERPFRTLALIALVLAVALVLLFFVDAQRYTVCGEETVEVQAAVGGTDDVLEMPTLQEFVKHGPNCLKIKWIQRSRDPKPPFFYDQARGANCVGKDMDPTDGIDRAPVFFFAGHGDPTKWKTDNGEVSPDCMHIGDSESGGSLRYYWQCSCEVFAHGPKQNKGSFLDYPHPWEFNAEYVQRDTEDQRNIFRRWSPVLGDNFRLACGSSTALTCGSEEIDRIFVNKNASLDVATSFIEGVYAGPGSAPLCIAGGRGTDGLPDPDRSGLADRVFSGMPRVKKEPQVFFYIEYPRPFGANEIESVHKFIKLPVYSLSGDVSGVSYQFESDSSFRNLLEKWRARKRSVLVYQNRRIVMSSLRVRCPEDPKCMSDGWYLEKAKKFLVRRGWTEPDLSVPEGFRLLIDSLPAHGADIVRFQRGTVVRFRRAVRVRSYRREFLEKGLDGNIVIVMNNEGSVTSAWKSWTPLEEVKRNVIFSAADFAALRDLALEKLGKDGGGYQISNFDLIYKRKQEELIPVAVLQAIPREQGTLIRFPPKLVEVELESISR